MPTPPTAIPRRVRSAPRSAGSVLLETLIALAILAVAFLFILPLFVVEIDLDHRARAHRETLSLLEAVIEAVRAGLLPLTSTELDLDTVPGVAPALDGLLLWMEVEKMDEADGLYRLQVGARYLVRGRLREQHLTTAVWRFDG